MKRLSCLYLLAFSVCAAAQTHDEIRHSVEQIQEKLETKQKPADLQQCQARVKELEDWGRVNVPKCTALLDELDARRDMDVIWKIFPAATGLGLGFGILWVAVRAVRRVRPFSKERKQLFTLLTVAAWISIAALVTASNAPEHPIAAVAYTFIVSLPAGAFGSVLFWWFGKKTGTASSST